MKKVILFGASTLGKKVFDAINKDADVVFFCDNDSAKWGSDFCGVPVISPEELVKHHKNTDYIIITSSYYYEIEKQLKHMGISNFYHFELLNSIAKEICYSSIYEKINKDIYIFDKLYIDLSSININHINYVMEGYIYFDDHWKPFEVINWDDSWDADPYSNDTWRLKLHILQHVYYLINEYDNSLNSKYLLQSISIVKSWLKENMIIIGNGILSRSPWAWNDHAVAYRSIILSYLLIKTLANDEEFSLHLIKALTIHGEYLSDINKYSPYNHGVMQDRSLFLISALLKDLDFSDKWYKIAINRLSERIDKDFSKNGVHLEHSARYHYIMCVMFDEIFMLLKAQNIEHKLIWNTKKIEDMKIYLSYLMNSNGSLPITGDTKYTNINENLSNKYIMKKGLFYCKESGVAIYNNNKSKLMFQAGFHSTIHKHADDCAFTLRMNDIDIFIDGGMYNYQEKDPFRKYVRSIFAYNSVAVDGKSYDLINDNIGKSKLIEVKDNEKYVYIFGSHNLYSGVQFNRELFYFKENNSIFICDSLMSEERHTYNQVFNLGEKVKIIGQHDNGFMLMVNEDFKIEIKQLKLPVKISTFIGNMNPLRGWYSKDFNVIEPITSIDFEGEGANYQFYTVINIGINGIIDVSLIEGGWVFEFRDGDKIITNIGTKNNLFT